MTSPIKAPAPAPKPEPVNPTESMIEQDRQMWALWLEWAAALDHMNAISEIAPDDRFASAVEIAASIERQMIDTPSGSPLGISVKLVIWGFRTKMQVNSPAHNAAMIRSATADAQRLAGVVLIREPGKGA